MDPPLGSTTRTLPTITLLLDRNSHHDDFIIDKLLGVDGPNAVYHRNSVKTGCASVTFTLFDIPVLADRAYTLSVFSMGTFSGEVLGSLSTQAFGLGSGAVNGSSFTMTHIRYQALNIPLLLARPCSVVRVSPAHESGNHLLWLPRLTMDFNCAVDKASVAAGAGATVTVTRVHEGMQSLLAELPLSSPHITVNHIFLYLSLSFSFFFPLLYVSWAERSFSLMSVSECMCACVPVWIPRGMLDHHYQECASDTLSHLLACLTSPS